MSAELSFSSEKILQNMISLEFLKHSKSKFWRTFGKTQRKLLKFRNYFTENSAGRHMPQIHSHEENSE